MVREIQHKKRFIEELSKEEMGEETYLFGRAEMVVQGLKLRFASQIYKPMQFILNFIFIEV